MKIRPLSILRVLPVFSLKNVPFTEFTPLKLYIERKNKILTNSVFV